MKKLDRNEVALRMMDGLFIQMSNTDVFQATVRDSTNKNMTTQELVSKVAFLYADAFIKESVKK